jgi:D-alanine-D-alanine ligase
MKSINVVMGGPTAEHAISLRTGREILLNIDRGKYRCKAVVVNRKKELFWADVASDIPAMNELEDCQSSPRFKGPYAAFNAGEIWRDCDAALLALHGSYGEDGVFQGYLESINVPYTGSGVYASAVAMNKITSKILFERAGLSTPPWSVYMPRNPEVGVETIAQARGFPCFVKCPQSGSSRLMGRAADIASLRALLAEYASEADRILVESAISGIEVSCPVLEYPGGRIEALPPIEIRPRTAVFFDYNAKYSDNASDEIVPAPQPPDVLRRIREIAMTAHSAIGCSGLTRTDIIISNGDYFVLEINTLPGLTGNSLAPKSFKSAGGTYSGLLDILIEAARVNKR